MERYSRYVTDQAGNVITGATITVRKRSDGLIATVFSDNGTTQKGNPFNMEADGEITFYAANGRYDIEISGPVSRIVEDVSLYDFEDSSLAPEMVGMLQHRSGRMSGSYASASTNWVTPPFLTLDYTQGQLWTMEYHLNLRELNDQNDGARVRLLNLTDTSDYGEFSYLFLPQSSVDPVRYGTAGDAGEIQCIVTTASDQFAWLHIWGHLSATVNSGTFAVQFSQRTATGANPVELGGTSWAQFKLIQPG